MRRVWFGLVVLGCLLFFNTPVSISEEVRHRNFSTVEIETMKNTEAIILNPELTVKSYVISRT